MGGGDVIELRSAEKAVKDPEDKTITELAVLFGEKYGSLSAFRIIRLLEQLDRPKVKK